MTDSISTTADTLPRATRPSLIQTWARDRLQSQLSRLSNGAIKLIEKDGSTRVLGTPVAGESPYAVHVHHPAFYDYAVFGGGVGLGEAYMLGHWSTSDLVGVSRLLLNQIEWLDQLESGLARLSLPLQKWFDWRHRNSKDNSRLNIAAHYDLGNDFFRLFLDRDMTYSAAMFGGPEDSLEAAQFRKLDTICHKLQLQPGEHLVEIGSGWGSFAVHAATHYGVRVTTTTLSREQHALATEKVRAAGLEDRITILLTDYRDLEGRYDKLVSIEMIEAVGHDYYPDYLKVCERLLKPGGQALIQAITCADQRYDYYRRSSDFIRRYIFPGGHLPSISELLRVATRHTRLRLFHLEDFSQDYARTLAEWRQRFWDRNAAIRAQGYSDTFVRMWDFYLATCEAAFAEHFTGVCHLLLVTPECRRETAGA